MSSPAGSVSPSSPRPGELTIEVLADGDAVILGLRGELDLGSAPVLAQALREAEVRAGRLVVDLRQLSFIDSTGIHLLLQAQLRTAGRLSLRRGPPEVQRVLELTKVADQFSFEDGQRDVGLRSQVSAAPPSEPAVGGRSAASPSG